MPQLSLYITDENLAILKSRAAQAGVSLSKYAAQLIEKDASNNGWPDNFWSFYGAIDDDTFVAPEDRAPSDDAEFEAMFS